MLEYTVKVNGMSCGHCKQSVEKAVGAVGATANVDLANGNVVLQYDEQAITLDAIVQAIEEQGYDVVR